MSFGVTVAEDLSIQAPKEAVEQAAAAPPVSRFPTALVAVGAIAAVGVGALMFVGRRRNPRRRLNPLVILGGVAAGLWWLGRRAVAQVREIVPAPAEETPLEGAFD